MNSMYATLALSLMFLICTVSCGEQSDAPEPREEGQNIVQEPCSAVYFATAWAAENKYLEEQEGVSVGIPKVTDKDDHYIVAFPAIYDDSGVLGSENVITVKVRKKDGHVYEPEI